MLGGFIILNRVFRVGLIEKVILDRRFESKVRKGARICGRASPKAPWHECAQLFQGWQGAGAE